MGSVSCGAPAKVPATQTRSAVEIRADADILAEMKALLGREARVSNRGIWTSAKHGVISLFSMIGNEEEKTANLYRFLMFPRRALAAS